MQAIGNNAFDNCTSLEVIVLGPDFNTMYPRMLAGVKNLKHVVHYGSRLDFTGANNGDAWEGIPSGQMTLYLEILTGIRKPQREECYILQKLGLNIIGKKFIIKDNLILQI
ncbi:hypothetical protein [Brachyspira alvinipulli]|uniref:hypothetical protein n=1 Tax=Brachyspira alvinipulli TaxID=84379 RepID=UPI0004BC0021|nr:hypothetical protein [Brachyspira alvinipulli]